MDCDKMFWAAKSLRRLVGEFEECVGAINNGYDVDPSEPYKILGMIQGVVAQATEDEKTN